MYESWIQWVKIFHLLKFDLLIKNHFTEFILRHQDPLLVLMRTVSSNGTMSSMELIVSALWNDQYQVPIRCVYARITLYAYNHWNCALQYAGCHFASSMVIPFCVLCPNQLLTCMHDFNGCFVYDQVSQRSVGTNVSCECLVGGLGASLPSIQKVHRGSTPGDPSRVCNIS